MKKKKKRNYYKFERHINTYYLVYLFVTFFIAAFALIGNAKEKEGYLQNLYLSLGTGLLTSAATSLIFFFYGRTKARNESLKSREDFISKFKLYYYILLSYLDFDVSFEGKLSLYDFIKTQHRWFHEYYKRLLVKNGSLKDTNLRLRQIKDFFKSQFAFFKEYFELDNSWKTCYLTKSERDVINNVYMFFKKSEISLEQNATKEILYNFAFFLEWLSRLPDVFKEMKSFETIKVSNNKSSIEMDLVEFYKKEPAFAQFDDLASARYSNYKVNYSKNVDSKSKEKK